MEKIKALSIFKIDYIKMNNEQQTEVKTELNFPNKSKSGVNFFMGKNRLGEKPFFQKN